VKIEIFGVLEMTKKLRKYQEQFPGRVGNALRVETEIDTKEAKKRTPVWTGQTGIGYPIPGVLRASVHAEGPFYEGTKISCSIVAGGLAGAYAMRQHEELDWFHPVGQAKYIESVIMESRSTMGARVARRLQRTHKII